MDERSWKEGGGGRKSKDKKINGERRVLFRKLKEVGWAIFNGNVEGDRRGDWTYTGDRRESHRLCDREYRNEGKDRQDGDRRLCGFGHW